MIFELGVCAIVVNASITAYKVYQWSVNKKKTSKQPVNKEPRYQPTLTYQKDTHKEAQPHQNYRYSMYYANQHLARTKAKTKQK